MTEDKFLNDLTASFKAFLESGSRSNKKLKILHSSIANDLIKLLGANYQVKSLSIGDCKEGSIQGRYIKKNVDIVILQNDKAIAGVGVKFVMQNYAQNSNNYFENMLGETANIRSENIPYFQIFVIPERMPYYKQTGQLSKWEEFSEHNSKKYLVLSQDNITNYLHTPNKTLLYVVKFPDITTEVTSREAYSNYYKKHKNLVLQKSSKHFGVFGSSVIYNNYSTFIEENFTLYSIDLI
jgi:hypothetical protein